MGAPTAYINSGIVTTIQGTNATYVNVVGSTKVTSPLFQGQDTNNPSQARVNSLSKMLRLLLDYG